MNVYRIDYCTAEDGWVSVWRGTQAEAKQYQKWAEGHYGRTNVSPWEAVEVPTSKTELLCWLNTHVRTFHVLEDADDTTGAGDE